MNTQTLQVFSLRGMDERWLPQPQDALYIQDMTWTTNDSWRTSGGFFQVYRPPILSEVVSTTTTVTVPDEPNRDQNNEKRDPEAATGPVVTEEEIVESIGLPNVSDDVFGTINSIHWFAQHNGARQWLIFEEVNPVFDKNTKLVTQSETVTLKAFYGSIAKQNASEAIDRQPAITLTQYHRNDLRNGVVKIKNRNRTALSIRTQSQSYGGRIYLVNGSDEPLVFDGDVCERAGFADRPPSPTGMAGSFMTSATFPIAVGDFEDDVKIKDKIEGFFGTIKVADYFSDKPNSTSFYSVHKTIPYWGLGAVSDATIGAGSYRFKGAGTNPFLDNEFSSTIMLRCSYYAGEQLDTRSCGYQYKVTYVNDRGQESEVSASSSILTIENGRGGKKSAMHGKNFISINLPLGPKECVARRIYRTRNVYDSNGNLFTKGEQRSFYFLSEITDNMTTVFVDGHPDTSLGPLLLEGTYGNFPSKTKHLAVFKNTMFAAGSDLNELRFSAPLFPEVFPRDNVIIIGDDDGGPITGMKTTRDALVVFKTRGIYLVKGDPVNGFYAKTLNKDIGCVAPDSIAELPGLGLAFLSERSVYLLEGALENTGSVTGVVHIGGEIPNQLERLNIAAAIRASSVVYQRDKEYWLSIPIDGSSVNNYCLIYHYDVGSWSVRKDFPIDCMVLSKDHRGYIFMGSNDSRHDTRSGILVYSRGTNLKGLKTIARDPVDLSPIGFESIRVESIYETVSNDYESVFKNFRPAHVMAYAVGYGDNGLVVNTRVNRSIDQVRQTAQVSDQQDPNESYPVYGKAIFGTDRWVSYRPTVIRYDVSTTHKGPVRELSVSFASESNNKIEIIGYDLEAKYGEQRNIKPLNKALRPSGR